MVRSLTAPKGLLRSELKEFYEAKARAAGRTLSTHESKTSAPGILNPKANPTNGLAPGSGQRVAWGAPNKVGHFTRGSSPREFGNKVRHDQMRDEAAGKQPPPPGPPPTRG